MATTSHVRIDPSILSSDWNGSDGEKAHARWRRDLNGLMAMPEERLAGEDVARLNLFAPRASHASKPSTSRLTSPSWMIGPSTFVATSNAGGRTS